MSDSEHSEEGDEGEEGPEWMYETLQSYRDLYQKVQSGHERAARRAGDRASLATCGPRPRGKSGTSRRSYATLP